MNEVLLPALLTAFFAGLLGSGHCFGMCGGIASGLGMMTRGAALAALAFNGGRLLSYMTLGALAAWLLGTTGAVIGVPSWGIWLRALAAVLIAAIGLQLLSGWRLLGFIERLGGRVWVRIQPMAVRFASQPGLTGRLALGACWGLLPCGLVYTLLLTAAASGGALAGATVMAAFGLGTMPAMLGMTLAAPALASFLAEAWTRRLVGAGLILLAAWSLVMVLVPAGGHH